MFKLKYPSPSHLYAHGSLIEAMEMNMPRAISASKSSRTPGKSCRAFPSPWTIVSGSNIDSTGCSSRLMTRSSGPVDQIVSPRSKITRRMLGIVSTRVNSHSSNLSDPHEHLAGLAVGPRKIRDRHEGHALQSDFFTAIQGPFASAGSIWNAFPVITPT